MFGFFKWKPKEKKKTMPQKQKYYRKEDKSTDDIFDPLNPLNPFSPLNPRSVYYDEHVDTTHHQDDFQDHSRHHCDHSYHHPLDCGHNHDTHGSNFDCHDNSSSYGND